MSSHVNLEGGVVGEALEADLTLEADSALGLAHFALAVGQHVLLQGLVGDETAAARPHWALERRLAGVRQPVEVQALLGHAAVAA